MVDRGSSMGQGPDFIIKRKKPSHSTGVAFYHKKGYSGNTSQGPRNQRNSVNQIIKKQTLYTGEHDLGNGAYAVEMLISQ